jgi:hypothetical protein
VNPEDSKARHHKLLKRPKLPQLQSARDRRSKSPIKDGLAQGTGPSPRPAPPGCSPPCGYDSAIAKLDSAHSKTRGACGNRPSSELLWRADWPRRWLRFSWLMDLIRGHRWPHLQQRPTRLILMGRCALRCVGPTCRLGRLSDDISRSRVCTPSPYHLAMPPSSRLRGSSVSTFSDNSMACYTCYSLSRKSPRLREHRLVGEPRVPLRGHDRPVPENLLKGGETITPFQPPASERVPELVHVKRPHTAVDLDPRAEWPDDEKATRSGSAAPPTGRSRRAGAGAARRRSPRVGSASRADCSRG